MRLNLLKRSSRCSRGVEKARAKADRRARYGWSLEGGTTGGILERICEQIVSVSSFFVEGDVIFLLSVVQFSTFVHDEFTLLCPVLDAVRAAHTALKHYHKKTQTMRSTRCAGPWTARGNHALLGGPSQHEEPLFFGAIQTTFRGLRRSRTSSRRPSSNKGHAN